MDKHECTQASNIEEIKRKVEHVDQTLYQGNGKPAMTVQIAVIDEKLNLLKNEIDNIKGYGKAIIAALLASIGATFWQMLQKHTAETYNTTGKTTTTMEVQPYDY